MNIGIVTVFDAVNYGSFLQAYCLQETIKNMGNDVTMIKTSSPLYEKWRFTSLFTYNPKKMKFKYQLAKGYHQLWKNFHVRRGSKKLDLLIVGSDEMWELNNVTLKPLPQFFGGKINAAVKATYAVSSNSTTEEDVKKYPFAIQGIKEFDYISVRDVSTYNAYRKYMNVEPKYTVDPTLLVDLHKYSRSSEMKDYILCYTYSFQPYMIDSVKQLAKQLNKKIVVVGQNFDWADICMPVNAFEFLGLIENASFVVTDTFHGATLSVGLKKEFVAFAYKTKVYRVLEAFDLLSRNVNEVLDLFPYYEEKINYDNIYKTKIEPLKKESYAYLKMILDRSVHE